MHPEKAVSHFGDTAFTRKQDAHQCEHHFHFSGSQWILYHHDIRSASSATCGFGSTGPSPRSAPRAYVNGQTITPLSYRMVTVSVSLASRTPRVATGVGRRC